MRALFAAVVDEMTSPISGGGNLAIWLSFIGIMFTAGVTVIVAALQRGRKELHSDHNAVQSILAEMKANQVNFIEDIRDVKGSIRKVHERLDQHLERHNEEQVSFRQRDRRALGG